MYGLHTVHDRLTVWADLRGITASSQDPMLYMGNYNVILTSKDRPQESLVQDVEAKDFNEFLVEVGVTEIRSTRCDFTWSSGTL